MKSKNASPESPESDLLAADPRSNSFASLLATLDGGECLHEASEKLAALVQRVDDVYKGGSLTLKINVKPAGAKRAMNVTASVSVKMPEEEREATILFATEDGLLTKQNPEQKELPLKVLEESRGQVKTIDETPVRQAKVV